VGVQEKEEKQMKKRMWVVNAMKEEMEVQLKIPLLGVEKKHTLPALGLADGCVGVLLVYRTKKAAQKYAGKYPITEIEDNGRMVLS
jgi:hypothetical protein